jgi:hypothetical protein
VLILKHTESWSYFTDFLALNAVKFHQLMNDVDNLLRDRLSLKSQQFCYVYESPQENSGVIFHKLYCNRLLHQEALRRGNVTSSQNYIKCKKSCRRAVAFRKDDIPTSQNAGYR